MGFSLLKGSAKSLDASSKYLNRYIDPYSFMVVGTLSIGIPVFIKVGISNIYSSDLFLGWFFGCAGTGLLIAGLMKLILKTKA